MKVSRFIFIVVFVILMANSLTVLSYSQDTLRIDKEKLANLIDSPKTKKILTAKMGFPPGVVFDMNTLAFDQFRGNVLVATLDFEYVPLAKHGTVSFAYRFVDGDYVLIYTSYWWWGTVAPYWIDTDTTWTAAEGPYYVTEGVYVFPGVTLTIEPGTVVRFRKFNKSGVEFYVEGTLLCEGATFTTSCDFENYDASNEYPHWWGIFGEYDSTCILEDSIIEYVDGIYSFEASEFTVSGCTVKNAVIGLFLFGSTSTNTIEDNEITDCFFGIVHDGLTSSTEISGNVITRASKIEGEAGIYCDSSSPLLTSNTISGDFMYGIEVNGTSSPNVTQNTIQNCDIGIYCESDSSPEITNNNIEGNMSYGVYNEDGAATINAEDNWWGDASGPYHATLNPGGLGDTVSDNVDFDPWLTSVVTAVLALSLR